MLFVRDLEKVTLSPLDRSAARSLLFWLEWWLSSSQKNRRDVSTTSGTKHQRRRSWVPIKTGQRWAVLSACVTILYTILLHYYILSEAHSPCMSVPLYCDAIIRWLRGKETVSEEQRERKRERERGGGREREDFFLQNNISKALISQRHLYTSATLNKGWQHVWIAFLNHSAIIGSTITLCLSKGQRATQISLSLSACACGRGDTHLDVCMHLCVRIQACMRVWLCVWECVCARSTHIHSYTQAGRQWPCCINSAGKERVCVCVCVSLYSGAAALRRQSGLAGYRKAAGSIPGSSWMSVEVSQTPQPDCSWWAGCRPAWLTPTWMRSCVRMLGNTVDPFGCKRYINAVHLPYYIHMWVCSADLSVLPSVCSSWPSNTRFLTIATRGGTIHVFKLKYFGTGLTVRCFISVHFFLFE